jgi:hypothetical protein
MKAQDFIIDTAGRTIDTIADEIIELFKKRVQGVEDSRVPG